MNPWENCRLCPRIFVSKKILGHIVFHSTTYIPYFSRIFIPFFSQFLFFKLRAKLYRLITRQFWNNPVINGWTELACTVNTTSQFMNHSQFRSVCIVMWCLVLTIVLAVDQYQLEMNHYNYTMLLHERGVFVSSIQVYRLA